MRNGLTDRECVLAAQAILEKEQPQGDGQGKADTPGVPQEQPGAPMATKHVKGKKTKAQKELTLKAAAVAESTQLKEKRKKVQEELRHKPEPVAESSGSEQSTEGEQSDEDKGDSDVSDLSEGEEAAHRRWRLMRGLEAPSDGSSDDISLDDWNDEEPLTVTTSARDLPYDLAWGPKDVKVSMAGGSGK